MKQTSWIAHVFLAVGVLLLSTTSPLVADEQLMAGCSVVDISPRVLPAIRNGGFLEQVSNRIDDPLRSRCVALSDGKQTLAIAVVDSCMIPTDVCDAIKNRVAESAKIQPEQILIAATHTHSAPSVMDFCLGTRKDEAYTAQLIDQVSQGIVAAVSDLRPARIGWSVVEAPDHTHCRRWLKHPAAFGTDPFGQVTVRAMMHPGYQNPEYTGPAGPVDTQLSLVSIQTADRQPLCLLANYSMHYFGAGEGFSADYFGEFAGLVEAKLQPNVATQSSRPFLAIMSQGTSGDLHWMDYSQPPRADFSSKQYAEGLASIALKSMESIEFRNSVKLETAQTRLKLSRRLPSEERLKWARELNLARGERRPKDLPEVYAEQAVWLHENPTAEVPLQAIRIGDLAIAALPNEVFGITGLKLKAQSPLQPLVVMELANGAEGYIPPPEQHALGGYTTWPARTAGLEIDAEPKIVAAMLELLEQIADGAKRRPLSTDFYNEQQRQAIEAASAANNNRENRGR